MNIKAAAQTGIKNPMVADAEALPFADNSVDGVLGMDVLSNPRSPL